MNYVVALLDPEVPDVQQLFGPYTSQQEAEDALRELQSWPGFRGTWAVWRTTQCTPGRPLTPGSPWRLPPQFSPAPWEHLHSGFKVQRGRQYELDTMAPDDGGYTHGGQVGPSDAELDCTGASSPDETRATCTDGPSDDPCPAHPRCRCPATATMSEPQTAGAAKRHRGPASDVDAHLYRVVQVDHHLPVDVLAAYYVTDVGYVHFKDNADETVFSFRIEYVARIERLRTHSVLAVAEDELDLIITALTAHAAHLGDPAEAERVKARAASLGNLREDAKARAIGDMSLARA